MRMKEEKKKQAALMKALETPEEKRARRLAKKEAKERKKREKMGWGEEYMGYTNTDNPFGDNNLLGTFIWSKVSAPRSACPKRQLCVSAQRAPGAAAGWEQSGALGEPFSSGGKTEGSHVKAELSKDISWVFL